MKVDPFIEAEEAAGHSVKRCCDLLQVSRSAFYQRRNGPPSARQVTDTDLTARIVKIHQDSDGTYGAPRMHCELLERGVHVGRRRVRRLMAHAGVAGRCPKRWRTTTIPDPTAEAEAVDLIRRHFGTSDLLDAAYGGDITYIPTSGGWAYLATVIDLASRRVVGWAVADHMRTSLVADALTMAFATRRPPAGTIFHPGAQLICLLRGNMIFVGLDPAEPWELLGGGNMNTVYRRGDTVVRKAGLWTPTVHRFLDYLHDAGINWVPRPLEFTVGEGGNPGVEKLTYLHGEVPGYPLPGWVWSEDVLRNGAQRLRCLHDASIGFAADGEVWQSRIKVPAEVVCHNDFAPHNLVFNNGRIVGAIDFDFCSPGPRLWDLAYYATRTVPLTSKTPENAPGMDQARDRVRLILDAYGDTAGTRFEDVVRLAAVRLHDLAGLSRSKAEELQDPQLLEDADGYDRDGRFLSASWR